MIIEMTLQDATERKRILEQTILDAIHTFEEPTGLTVSSIAIERVGRFGRRPDTNIIAVEAKIELGSFSGQTP